MTIRFKAWCAVAATAALSVLVACGDFAHTNPWEPDVAVTLAISGPDTVYTAYDTVQFTVRSTPDVPGAIPSWDGGDYNMGNMGNGRFVVATGYINTPVRVRVGPHEATRMFYARQRTMRFGRCDDDPPGPIVITGLGDVNNGCMQQFDARGYQIYEDPTHNPPKIWVRDSSIVLPLPSVQFQTYWFRLHFNARARGQTYVLLESTRGGVSHRDSVLVIVK